MQLAFASQMNIDMMEEIEALLFLLVVRKLVAARVIGVVATAVSVFVIENAGGEGRGVG